MLGHTAINLRKGEGGVGVYQRFGGCTKGKLQVSPFDVKRRALIPSRAEQGARGTQEDFPLQGRIPEFPDCSAKAGRAMEAPGAVHPAPGLASGAPLGGHHRCVSGAGKTYEPWPYTTPTPSSAPSQSP